MIIKEYNILSAEKKHLELISDIKYIKLLMNLLLNKLQVNRKNLDLMLLNNKIEFHHSLSNFLYKNKKIKKIIILL